MKTELLAAMALYYSHRKAANEHCQKWDKDADLKNIDKVCVKYKLGFTAIAGTFWILSKNSQTRHDEAHIEGIQVKKLKRGKWVKTANYLNW